MEPLPPPRPPQAAPPKPAWNPTGPAAVMIGGMMLFLTGLLLLVAVVSGCHQLVGIAPRPAECRRGGVTGGECLAFPIIYVILLAVPLIRRRPMILLLVGLVGMITLGVFWFLLLPVS